MITVIAGGVGAARLLRGMAAAFDPPDLCAVVNVADDETVHGLHVSPDLDTVTYTLAGTIDSERGWGLTGETWEAMATLRRCAAANGRPDIGWFSLGDRDLGTHLYRTSRLAEGSPLSTVTEELARGWGVGVRLLPVTDDRLATRVISPGLGELAFQEYFVRHAHDVEVDSVHVEGIDRATPGPGVLEALNGSAVLVIAPSNPIVSVGPVLGVAGVREAVAARRDRCVAVSPIVGGRALKGPADRLMVDLGHECSVVGVARLYRDVASVLVVDEADSALAGDVEAEGMRCVVCPTVMVDLDTSAALARAVVGSVGGHR